MSGARHTFLVLGAGSALVRAGLGCSGYALVRPNGRVLLVDCGPGTLRSLAACGHTLEQVDAVLLSHEHADHVADLVHLLFARRNPRLSAAPALEIVGAAGTREIVARALAFLGREALPSGTTVRELGAHTLGGGALISVPLISEKQCSGTPRSETLRSETPRSETLRSETPHSETPRSATPRSATPRSDSPRSDTPSSATPSSATPSSDSPRSDALCGISFEYTPTGHTDTALAFAFDVGGARLVYSGDCGDERRLVELAQGAELLVCECSSSDDAPLEGHLTPSAVARLAAAARPRHLLLTHFYPELDPATAVHAVRAAWSGEVAAACDGLGLFIEGGRLGGWRSAAAPGY